MAHRDHRKGLATTTISVKLTAAELAALDEARKHERSALDPSWVSYYETRGDALRRIIGDAESRRLDLVKLNDPRQVTLTEAIAATPPADKTERCSTARRPRKTKPRPRLRKTRRRVLSAGRKGRGAAKSRIRR